MSKKIIAMLIVIVMMMVFFTACEDMGEYDEYSYYNSYNDYYDRVTDLTGRYNYVHYKGTYDIVEIDSCIKYFDRDTGVWMYEITINGQTNNIACHAVNLYGEYWAAE